MANPNGPSAIDGDKLVVASLRGCLNDTDSSLFLNDDALQTAENVEFAKSTCGERRLGCQAIVDLPASISGDATLTAVTFATTHQPTSDAGLLELWLLAQSLATNNHLLTRRTQTAWSTVTLADAATVTAGKGHRMAGTTLHGKLMHGYKSGLDRLHVWDNTSHRRAGLAEPAAAPTAADTAVAGAYSGTRYVRVRYIRVDPSDGTSILLRSEPSVVRQFIPNGAFTGMVVTRPALLGESETHWEVEFSNDNANFYKLSNVPVATTTYTDTTAASPGYASAATALLSEDIGDYTLLPSAKYLCVDDDRLLLGGSWEDDAMSSRIFWTPVNSDPGVGNDERLKLGVNPYRDLDGIEGGELTGLKQGSTGYVFAFKRSRIYKLIRTGTLIGAYDTNTQTRARGALPGSVVEAVDQTGQSALYFLDPAVGPCRLGVQGIEWCGYDVQKLWARVEVDAAIPCHGIYYSDKQQVHWWVAVDGSDYPNAKLILHCNRSVRTAAGVRNGWVTVPVGNRIASAHCSTMFASNAESTDPRSVRQVPFIGKAEWAVGGATIRDLWQRCEVGNTDALTTDDVTAYYQGIIKTKPYTAGGLFNQFGVLSGAVVAEASPNALITVRAIKNFNADISDEADISLTPSDAAEVTVIRRLEDLGQAEVTALEIEFGDLRPDLSPAAYWEVQKMEFKLTPGETV
jgi:hypothetical protein